MTKKKKEKRIEDHMRKWHVVSAHFRTSAGFYKKRHPRRQNTRSAQNRAAISES